MPPTRGAAKAVQALMFGLGAASAYAAAAHATACTDLTAANITLPAPATLVSFTAQDVTGGTFTPPGGAPITGLPPFCRVAAVVSSRGNPNRSQSAIEVWMPEAGWNGRYLGTGNGGFAGAVAYTTLQIGLLEGFSAANTDMGTGILFGCNSLYCGNHTGFGGKPGGLYDDVAALQDFGYQATHLMTIVGKQMTAAYYAQTSANQTPANQTPAKSYFDGCSTGGQQALMESQRFPDDYDGILAGAPAHNRTHLHLTGSAVYEATHFAPDAYLTDAALSLAHQTVLGHCAGKDGGLQSDDFLTQPASCTVKAQVAQCKGSPGEVPCTDPAASSCTCLAADQAKAMDRDWDGAKDTLGNTLYPGAERGSEEPVALTPANGFVGNLGLPWQQSGTEPAFDSLIFWALGPNFVWQDLFGSTDHLANESAKKIATVDNTPVGDSTFAGVLNANSTDLSAFAGHGGKMVMYHGYADPLIPSATAIDYYNAVATFDPAGVGNYLRLFMAPGVWHCNGGPGANAFGNLSSNLPPAPLDPSDDLLGALIAWVEAGVPPTQVTATKYVNDLQTSGIAFQRPLCLYPAHSAYQSGDPTQASSYACAAGVPVTNQGFSPIYGP